MKNVPEQEQIDHWLAWVGKWLPNKKEKIARGEGTMGTYSSLAAIYATDGRAKFLNGEAIEDVRREFAEAARHILEVFTMAYDEADPDYQGEKADLSCVSEDDFIEGADYALMAADFQLAAKLAGWYRTRPDGYMLGVDINRYALALAFALRERFDEARSLLRTQMEEYGRHPPKSLPGRNYHTLVTTLSGIAEGDEAQFNQGLFAQLQFYDRLARGEYKDTAREFICDHAVALANLALHCGLRVTVEYDTLPERLLIQP